MADLPVPPPTDPAMPAALVPPPNWPASQDPAAPQAHIGHQLLDWSHFRPEFTVKPEEDAEAHHLHTNDWLKTHIFQEM